MRLPVPNNRLVAFTLAGALLTAVVAGALAAPLGGLAGAPEETADATLTQQLGDDAPTPNEEFTPAVQTQSPYEEHEDEEYEEHEDEEHEEYEADDDEYEEHEEEDEYGDDDEEYEANEDEEYEE